MSKLTKIFSAVLGIPEEKIDENLAPANTPSWDSLNSILLLTEIEAGYGVKFDYTEAMAVKSFGDAIKLVASKNLDPYAA